MLAALTFGTAGWTIQPATDTATVRSVAGLSIDQFEKLQLPLLPREAGCLDFFCA